MAQPNSTQASSFTCFSKLPREIQLNIWEYSLPPPRMICISSGRLRFPTTDQSAGDIHIWLERRPVPTILHASVDSRKVGLKHYELILDTTTSLDLSLPSFNKRKKAAYVDLARDILGTRSRFYLSAFLEATPQTILNRIRYFAYSCSYCSIFGIPEIKELMKGLPALDGLAIIRDRVQGVDYWHKLTLDLSTKLKNDRETVPKISRFGNENDFEKALQNKKLWGAESAIGLLEPARQSSVENIL